MGIFRNFLRQWRERRDGTLEGPSLSTEEADIGGAVWLNPGDSITGKLDELGQGGSIIVTPGTYNETFEFRANQQTVTAIGDVIVDGGSDRAWEQGSTTDVTQCRVDGVRFRSDASESARIRSGSKRIIISNCEFESLASGLSGMAFIPCPQISFAQCYFHSPGGDYRPLYIAGDRCRVVGCEFDAPSTAETIGLFGDNSVVATNIIEGSLADSGANNETTINVIY